VDTFVTLCGNVVADPTRKATPSGVSVAGLRIASTPRRFDRTAGEWKDGPTLFINVTCWRGLADNVAKSLHKGDPVIVYGRLILREWTDKENQLRHAYEVDAAVVGPDLSRAECGQIRRPVWSAPAPSWVSTLQDPQAADGAPGEPTPEEPAPEDDPEDLAEIRGALDGISGEEQLQRA
jgi:single-strand DNA-binding protein